MKKLIQIKITGSHSQRYLAGEDFENDFLDAIKSAAATLQQQQLHTAEVCLFENENDSYEQAIKRVELMHHA